MANINLQLGKETNLFQKLQRLVQQGQHQQALNQLDHFPEQNPAEKAEWYYRLGNLFYDAQVSDQAKQAWEKSVLLRKAASSLPSSALKVRPFLWNTIGLTILIIFSAYCLIVLLFPRQFDLMDMILSMQQEQRAQQEELSFWDRFWMTGRPMQRQYALEQNELWSELSRQMNDIWNLFSPDEPSGETMEDRFVEWLNRVRYGQFLRRPLQGKSEYYYLLGRGLFNIRQHSEAIEALNNGLRETTNPQERGVLFQEMATIYYYQGYYLQPDGLAKYDLESVRKSVAAYQQALQYIEDPYVYGNLGWGYYLLADYDRAIYYSKKALQINARLSYVRMNMGITYLRMNDYQKSFEAYQELLKLDPKAIDYIGGLRDLEELNRDFSGQYPFVYFIIGYIYHHQGIYHQAQKAWNTFLQQPFSDNSWKRTTRQMLKNMRGN